WWGTSTPPAGVSIGTYGGSGVGLSTGGDAVAIFDGSNTRVTGISFDASTTNVSFDNSAGLGGTGNPAPKVSTLSALGVRGAFTASDGVETGSPGVAYLPPTFSNVPFDISVEASGVTTPVPFTAPTATDLVNGTVAPTCTPASPGPFPIATTTVSC